MKKFSNVIRIILCFSLATVLLQSCEKEPGEGGNSSIYGKVIIKDYNSSFTVLRETYYGPDIDVYIIYGDEKSVSDRTRTSYDGTYEFKYLRPGNYTIYAYSKDSTLQTNAPVAVLKRVTIEKKKQEVQAPDIILFD